MNFLVFNPLVAIWKTTGNVVILHKALFGSHVEFPNGICYLQAELGPESDFEIIGEL